MLLINHPSNFPSHPFLIHFCSSHLVLLPSPLCLFSSFMPLRTVLYSIRMQNVNEWDFSRKLRKKKKLIFYGPPFKGIRAALVTCCGPEPNALNCAAVRPVRRFFFRFSLHHYLFLPFEEYHEKMSALREVKRRDRLKI